MTTSFFAGMIVYINKVSQCRHNITLEKTLITLENSKFLNYNGDTDSLFLVMKRLDYMSATALSMYVKNDEVMVKIHNVIIVNCSCFLGSLIEISLVSLISSTNTKIYFHNTTIFNNTQAESTGIQGIKIKQVYILVKEISLAKLWLSLISVPFLTIQNFLMFWKFS